LAKIASRVMSGKTLPELGVTSEIIPKHVAVKEAVLPFDKFPGTDTLLGPEMRSTGEVMGIDSDFGKAFAKAELAASVKLALKGTVFVSMSDRCKEQCVPVVKDLIDLGLKIVATSGTAKVLQEKGLDSVETVLKVHEGRPNVIDLIKNESIQIIFNIPSGEESQADGRKLRRTALDYKLPIITTIAGGRATVAAIKALQTEELGVKALQDYI
jgi:carbamoyl-phosphate synthase large subunit